ncbi:hypothetical protein KR222_002845, partial [Zaprionus bogoriensis]
RIWDFEALDIAITSSDETKLNGPGKVERVARGQSVISLTVHWMFDTDIKTTCAFNIYHSQSGRNDDYSPTPYKIEEIKFTGAINMKYDELVYKNFGHCSNLEEMHKKFVPPFPRKTYELRKCTPNTFGFPDILILGYYKIVARIRGEVDFSIILIFKLKSRF